MQEKNNILTNFFLPQPCSSKCLQLKLKRASIKSEQKMITVQGQPENLDVTFENFVYHQQLFELPLLLTSNFPSHIENEHGLTGLQFESFANFCAMLLSSLL